jgi:hypothetical protein
MPIEDRIYRLATASNGTLTAELVWPGDGAVPLARGYSQIAPVEIAGRTFLLAYNRTAATTDTYVVADGPPLLQRLDGAFQVSGGPWDTIDTFAFGNTPYLLTYRRDTGRFGFSRVLPDASLSSALEIVQTRLTSAVGFTTVKAFPTISEQYVFGYNIDTGVVGAWSVTMRTVADGDAPPFSFRNVWYHQWAHGWTRFAFFALGGSTFFLKTNVARLNVNIDHIHDNPALGSSEVSTHLEAQLPGALDIDSVARVPWPHQEPYFSTYLSKTGEMRIYRIHSDCQGWSRVYSGTTLPGATMVVPYRVGDTTYVLFYAGGAAG